MPTLSGILNEPGSQKSDQKLLSQGHFAHPARYKLALQGRLIRFRDSFENLICLADLHDVRSLWYQEETARKVLKSFRGRALLSDEVGLGKTIEASMILKEYILPALPRPFGWNPAQAKRHFMNESPGW